MTLGLRSIRVAGRCATVVYEAGGERCEAFWNCESARDSGTRVLATETLTTKGWCVDNARVLITSTGPDSLLVTFFAEVDYEWAELHRVTGL